MITLPDQGSILTIESFPQNISSKGSAVIKQRLEKSFLKTERWSACSAGRQRLIAERSMWEKEW